jgi:hypothetical protein
LFHVFGDGVDTFKFWECEVFFRPVVEVGLEVPGGLPPAVGASDGGAFEAVAAESYEDVGVRVVAVDEIDVVFSDEFFDFVAGFEPVAAGAPGDAVGGDFVALGMDRVDEILVTGPGGVEGTVMILNWSLGRCLRNRRMMVWEPPSAQVLMR